mmetsp:Transcript_19434/g.51660  ORF Transcript_19434/g.51660 Transcript_19434/m.51660 type:complete len:146 (-) Transcript_19434:902-1339(-)
MVSPTPPPAVLPLSPSLSPAAALDAAREIRRAKFGIQEDEDAFMEGPVKLSAPKRMDGEGAILAKGDGATKDLGGGNANQQLDRRNEAEAAKALAQARKERAWAPGPARACSRRGLRRRSAASGGRCGRRRPTSAASSRRSLSRG